MQTNNNMTPLDKSIVLLSYINDRNPSLFSSIIQSLPKHHVKDILDRLKEKPLYNKNELTLVLSEYNELTVDGTMVFPNESFKDNLQKKMIEPPIVSSNNGSNELWTISNETLLALIDREPIYFVGLLCHLLPKDQFAKILSIIPDKAAKEGLSFFTKINPSNLSLLDELKSYYLDHAQRIDGRISEYSDQTSMNIAQILELMPNSNKDNLKSMIPSSISWQLIEDYLLSFEDIQFFNPSEQQQILSAIDSSEKLAKSLYLLPKKIQQHLINNCLTSRQGQIIKEEISYLHRHPINEEEKLDLANSLVQTMRKLQQEKIIGAPRRSIKS